MSLNIKNPETYKLAQQLAKATGESMTTAVTTAVRERLIRVQKRKRKGMADRLLEIATAYSANLPEPFRSLDHGEMLYNEKGLPK